MADWGLGPACPGRGPVSTCLGVGWRAEGWLGAPVVPVLGPRELGGPMGPTSGRPGGWVLSARGRQDVLFPPLR